MNYRVAFSPDAIQDFNDLYGYIVSDAGTLRARNYVGKLYDYCLSFETFPERGIRRHDISPGLRIVGYRRRATIAFRIDGAEVTIVRVFPHGRNIVFGSEPNDT